MVKTVVTPHILDPSFELGKWLEMERKIFVAINISLSYGTHITEKHLRTLFALFFGRALDKMCKNGNIWHKMTKNGDFGPNLAVFWPKSLIFMGVSKSFGTNITETT